MLRTILIIKKHRIKQKMKKLTQLWRYYREWCKEFDRNYDLEIQNLKNDSNS